MNKMKTKLISIGVIVTALLLIAPGCALESLTETESNDTPTTPVPESTMTDEQRAIGIAKADPRVKELLDKGASIGKVSPVSFRTRLNSETGETEEFSGTLVRVEIERGEKSWTAYVDLGGELVMLVETTPGARESDSSPQGGAEYFHIEEDTIEE